MYVLHIQVSQTAKVYITKSMYIITQLLNNIKKCICAIPDNKSLEEGQIEQ